MQSSEQFLFKSWGLIALALLGIIVFLLLRRGISACRSPSTMSFPNPGVNTLGAVAWSWLAPSAVVAIFIGLSGALGRETENRLLYGPISVEKTKPSVVSEASSLPSDPAKEKPSADTTRPKWLEEGDRTNGDVRTIVLSSKLWSTEAEANQELLPRAAKIVRDDFDERHQSPFQRTGHRLLSDERLVQFAVKRRYLERIDQDFGTFSAPMCRLWMQVEVSPLVRTAIYPDWKSAVVGNRAILIGAVLALLTLSANALALFGRLKNVAQQSWIYSGTIAASSALAWVVCGLYLVRCLRF